MSNDNEFTVLELETVGTQWVVKGTWVYPETGEPFRGDHEKLEKFSQSIEPKGDDLDARMNPVTGEVVVLRPDGA